MPALEMIAAKRGDPFRVLVGTVLSLRTRDETTLPALWRLLALAGSVEELARSGEAAVAEAIRGVAFHRVKAGQLLRIAQLLLDRHQGRVPDSLEALLALPGVGLKTANMVLGLGFGIPAICVDIHVHRICNRLGALTSRTPDETEHLLTANLPEAAWLSVNPVLVAFGQSICTPVSPHCTQCPVPEDCHRVGVGSSR